MLDAMDQQGAKGQHDHLDPYEKPPEALRAIFKSLKARYNTSSKAARAEVVDLSETSLPALGRIPETLLLEVLSKFGDLTEHEGIKANLQVYGKAYTSEDIPGRGVSLEDGISFGFVKREAEPLISLTLFYWMF
jgi:ribosomal 50S subunit-associated protein YjgA (DUF615 family)